MQTAAETVALLITRADPGQGSGVDLGWIQEFTTGGFGRGSIVTILTLVQELVKFKEGVGPLGGLCIWPWAASEAVTPNPTKGLPPIL